MAAGIECFRVEFPAGQDANDVAVAARSRRRRCWAGRSARRRGWAAVRARPAAAARRCPNRRMLSRARARARAPSGCRLSRRFLLPGRAGAGACRPSSRRWSRRSRPLRGADEPGPEVTGREVTLALGERRWRVRGLDKASSFDVLRVNVMVSRRRWRPRPRFHVDTLDLYSARARAVFIAGRRRRAGPGRRRW